MAELKKSVMMVIVASVDTLIGKVEVRQDANAEKKISYIYFNNVITPAKGKKPEAMFVETWSSLKTENENISILPEDAVFMLYNKKMPLVMAACKNAIVLDEEENVVEMTAGAKMKKVFADIALMVDSLPSTSKSVIRKVDDHLISRAAYLYVIAAGTTGILPTSEDLLKLLTTDIMDKARIKAVDMLTTNGVDVNGQINTKAPKKKEDVKAEEKKAENTAEGEDTEDEDESTEGTTED